MPYKPPRDDENLSLDEIEEREALEKRQEKKDKQRFNIFSRAYADGKGVEKDEEIIADNPNLVNFFKLLGRKINELLTVNIMMVVGNFPIFFFLFAMSGFLSLHTSSPYYTMFAPLRGAQLFNDNAVTTALMNIFGRQAEVTVLSTADYVLIALSALFLLTFGPVRIGITYIVRNMFRGEPVMMFHDFFYAIKRNLRQSIIYGIMDVLICGIIIYDIVFFNINYNVSMITSTMFFMSLCLAMLYFFMRQYIYLMIVTFDLSIFKMFKNAIRFTVLGVKRNFMAFLGVLLVGMLEYVLIFAYFPLAAIMPFVIIPSLLVLIGIYSVYPVIKKWMIDPFYEKVDSEV